MMSEIKDTLEDEMKWLDELSEVLDGRPTKEIVTMVYGAAMGRSIRLYNQFVKEDK
jgi:hypothetical protein